MIKLVIFDLDGVLVEMKRSHYESLNKALGIEYEISWEEHLSIFDGLKTNEKLRILSNTKKLPVELYKKIWEDKQKYTLEYLKTITDNNNIIELMHSLSVDNFKIAVCSNSIRKTVLISLSKLGIIEYVDLILSNEDVVNSKPHPEIYWKAISTFNVLPEETLIVEDSPPGLLAATRSNSNVLRVDSSENITHKYIYDKINQLNNTTMNTTPKWTDNNLNVIIPMAGAGSRFEKSGYTFPKPLIDVKNKPMIQVVVDNLNISATYIYIVQKSHRKKYNLDTLLNLITPNCKIIEVDEVTQGAACTALLAKKYIDNKNPLFIANSDQFVEWNSNEFMYKMNETDVDGGIVTFKSVHPKWSFAKIDNNGFVTEVAEKNPISDNATVGFYYWKHGCDFVKYTESMINKNLRYNNEFYICPVFNQAIEDNKKIKSVMIDKMWGLGTPEDLFFFLENYK